MKLEGVPVANDFTSFQRLRWLTYKRHFTTLVLCVKEVLSLIRPDIVAWLGPNLRKLLVDSTYFSCRYDHRMS